MDNKLEIEEKLKTFILTNSLDFGGYNSDLNSNCCIISGYALYLGATTSDIIEKVIDELYNNMDEIKEKYDVSTSDWYSYEDELKKVFDYAKEANYGEWWKKPEAKTQYNF